MEEVKQINATSVEDLKKMSDVRSVLMPPFYVGEDVIFKLKRPSLLSMASKGRIPNALLGEANELFMTGISDEDMDENTLKNMHDLFELMAFESMVEPTYEELKEAGIELTDAQLLFIYNYSQHGITSLFPFRQEQ